MIWLLFIGMLAADSPTAQIVELLEQKLSKVNATATKNGWEGTLPVEVRLENSPAPTFLVMSDPPISVSVTSSAPANPSKPDIRFMKLHLKGDTAKPPSAAYLYAPGMKSPAKLELGMQEPPPEWIDTIVMFALVVSTGCVFAGFIWSGDHLWADIGQQTFSADSWVTNLTLAGGLLAFVIKLFLTGSDGLAAYTLLSSISAVIAAASPVLFNLTTRTENATRKGRVFFFLISAALTSGAAMTQVATAARAISDAQTAVLLSPLTLSLIRGVLAAVLLALASYVVRSTRDTIKDQVNANIVQNPKPGPRVRQLPQGTWTYPAL